MDLVSHLSGGWGWEPALLVIAGGIVVWRFLGRFEAALVVASGPISLLYLAFKLAVNRPRPTPDLVRVIETEQGSSFPSGHAFFAILFWGLLAYLAFTHLHKPGLRALTLSVCAAIILIIGASRVYLGVHWPSDVLGGYIAGSPFLVLLIWLELKQKVRPHTPKNG